MKTIGLLGGMSWQSTQSYYQLINGAVAQRLGGLHSAKIALVSVDFAPIAALQAQQEWQKMAGILSKSARQLEAAGADCVLICTNTMHLVAEQVQQAVSIPLLHIADATAVQLQTDGVSRVALLGTAFTMQKTFYKTRLQTRFGIDVMVPEDGEQRLVHDVIYQELCQGLIQDDSRQGYIDIVNRLAELGAEAVILGCTEIGLLLQQQDVTVPLYDTARLHALAAVDFALA